MAPTSRRRDGQGQGRGRGKASFLSRASSRVRGPDGDRVHLKISRSIHSQKGPAGRYPGSVIGGRRMELERRWMESTSMHSPCCLILGRAGWSFFSARVSEYSTKFSSALGVGTCALRSSLLATVEGFDLFPRGFELGSDRSSQRHAGGGVRPPSAGRMLYEMITACTKQHELVRRRSPGSQARVVCKSRESIGDSPPLARPLSRGNGQLPRHTTSPPQSRQVGG